MGGLIQLKAWPEETFFRSSKDLKEKIEVVGWVRERRVGTPSKGNSMFKDRNQENE